MLRDEYISIKIMLYTTLSIFLTVPIMQLVYRRYAYCYLFTFLSYFVAPDNYYIDSTRILFSFGMFSLMFIIGFMFYLFYYPECRHPKTFDKLVTIFFIFSNILKGCSHNIMHTFVFFGLLYTHKLVYQTYELRYNKPCFWED